MKILIVSNLYPPHYVGGYELRCSQVAEYLRRAGHEVRVLASSYRLPTDGEIAPEPKVEHVGGIAVERFLHHFNLSPRPSGHLDTFAMANLQLLDARRFIEVLDEFEPDIVNWWNLEGLTKTILPIPATRHIPDVCWVEDNWMIHEHGVWGEKESLSWFDFWRGSWGPRMCRPLLRRAMALWEKRVQREGIPTRPFPTKPAHVCFISEFMQHEHRRAGLELPSSEVIYGGVSTARFSAQRTAAEFEKRRLRFLYAGYVNPDRGLHTIIEALGLLPHDERERIELSVAQTGPPMPGEYIREVKKRIESLGLSKMVSFLGKIRHDDMARVYRTHHVLISATTRSEGLPMTMMEAMCAGCAVITTGSGGAIEIADIADLPIFPKDHPVALSRLIAKLVRDRELVFQIATRGQKVVLREFSFTRMAERICNTLDMLCEQTEKQTKAHVHLAV